jgi:hypothetical protein
MLLSAIPHEASRISEWQASAHAGKQSSVFMRSAAVAADASKAPANNPKKDTPL